MKIKVGDLLSAIKVVEKNIPRVPTHPILGTLLFKPESSTVKLTSYDLTHMSEAEIPYQGDKVDSFCLGEFQKFKDLLGLLTKESFLTFSLGQDYGSVEELQADEPALSTVTLTHSTGTYILNCQSPEEYPAARFDLDQSWESEEDGFFVELDEKLIHAFKIIQPHINVEHSHPSIRGANFVISKEGSVNCYGSCGHTVGWAGFKGKQFKSVKDLDQLESSQVANIIISPQVLDTAIKLGEAFKLYVGGGLFKLEIYAKSRDGVLQKSPYTFSGHLISGEYPNIESLIPRQHSNTMDFALHPLLETIKRCCLFCDSRRNTVSIKASDDVQVSNDFDNQLFSERVDGSFDIESEIFLIHFAINYMRDTLKALADVGVNAIQLRMTEPSQPVVFALKGIAINSGVLLMPVRKKTI